VELGGARWPGSGGSAGELGRLEVGDGTDSWARLTERRGRGGRLGRREPKGKTYFPRRRDRRAGWMGWPGWFWPTAAARPVGWLGQRPRGAQGQRG
jgi:hypothetical protein